MLKQILLAAALIVLPVAVFSAVYIYLVPSHPAQASLGDLSALKAIAADVESIAAKGDLAAAQKRITDFETEWDKDEAVLRPANESAWGTIDDAADAAIHSLRAGKPDPDEVVTSVKGLIASLNNPYGGSEQAGVKMVKGVPVTDDSGHPLACETMIKALRAAIEGGKIPSGSSDAASRFVSQALERCNADDDANANNFSAQGLALASSG